MAKQSIFLLAFRTSVVGQKEMYTLQLPSLNISHCPHPYPCKFPGLMLAADIYTNLGT